MSGLDRMTDFVAFLIDKLPAFLAAEPIIYIIAFGLFGYIIMLVVSIIRFR